MSGLLVVSASRRRLDGAGGTFLIPSCLLLRATVSLWPESFGGFSAAKFGVGKACERRE